MAAAWGVAACLGSSGSLGSSSSLHSSSKKQPQCRLRRPLTCCPPAHVPSLLPQCAAAEKKSAGGVLLANDSGDKPNFGVVVSVGEGKKGEDGAAVAPNVAVGATVMYSKYSGTEFEVRPRGPRSRPCSAMHA